MKRSCKHCGRYHDTKFDCGRKLSRIKNLNDADTFRNTRSWKRKSAEIRERDKGLCQVCIRRLYNTTKLYNFENIEVHHIVPLMVDQLKGLDNTNLISLCKYHHTMADDYKIHQYQLYEMVREQENMSQM